MTPWKWGSFYICCPYWGCEKIPSCSEKEEELKLESSLWESYKAGRQAGEDESRDIKRKKKSRHRGTQVSLTLMAKVFLNWIVLEVNYLLREWQRIAISVQWTLEEEWNPCCMLILFGVLAKYTPNGLILRYQKKKWGFNSPWFSVCHTRWRGWDLLSSSLCPWHKVEPIAFQIFLGAWQSKPWG